MQPYFTEQWFGPEKISRLLEALNSSVGAGSIVEVGSWEGRSTIAIANQCFPEPVHSIDHWQGDIGNPKMAALAASRNVYATFVNNMNIATKGNYVVHKMSWRDVDWNALAPIKFLFIDGDHTVREVFDNISVALPLMCKGGVIAGDDYSFAEVRQAVKAILGKVNCKVSGRFADVWYKVI